jgi:hypothetical protein
VLRLRTSIVRFPGNVNRRAGKNTSNPIYLERQLFRLDPVEIDRRRPAWYGLSQGMARAACEMIFEFAGLRYRCRYG